MQQPAHISRTDDGEPAGRPRPLVVLTGATASGKEAVGLLLAERAGTEIVVVDSIKVYRGMDIGAAKPTAEQLARVRHHCLDLVEPAEAFSTGRWINAAEAAIADIAGRGKLPLLVGGTALYMKALTEGLFDGPPADPAVRSRLNKEGDRRGTPELHRRLTGVDAAAAAKIHPNDRKRIIRALEVHELTGRPLSEQQQQWNRPNPAYDITWLGLRRDREDLHRRIDVRVRRMFEAGLVEEVRRIAATGGGFGPTAREALAYREVLEHLAGRLTLPEAIAQTVAHTRQFAKRQGTWFRRFHRINWFDVPADEPAEQTVERLTAAGLPPAPQSK
jgi:tRNA dimethylallyltransferase